MQPDHAQVPSDAALLALAQGANISQAQAAFNTLWNRHLAALSEYLEVDTQRPVHVQAARRPPWCSSVGKRLGRHRT
jgi:hypothetical protein